MRLSSPAFVDGGRIPPRHTADGEDVSVPLVWTAPPGTAAELALLVDDPDAPGPTPWVHWLIYHIPADCRELDPGVPRRPRLSRPEGACQGRNSWSRDNIGYRGPAPPHGDGPHRYRFTLYALERELDLEPGADRDELVGASEGLVLDRARLSGTYER